MDAEDLRRLESVGSEVEVAAGHLVIEHGQPGAGLYVVLDGEVLVEAPEATRELGPGACIGERALLAAHGIRSARVRAKTDVRLLAVDRIAFERLCADDPALAGRLGDASS